LVREKDEAKGRIVGRGCGWGNSRTTNKPGAAFLQYRTSGDWGREGGNKVEQAKRRRGEGLMPFNKLALARSTMEKIQD